MMMANLEVKPKKSYRDDNVENATFNMVKLWDAKKYKDAKRQWEVIIKKFGRNDALKTIDHYQRWITEKMEDYDAEVWSRPDHIAKVIKEIEGGGLWDSDDGLDYGQYNTNKKRKDASLETFRLINGRGLGIFSQGESDESKLKKLTTLVHAKMTDLKVRDRSLLAFARYRASVTNSRSDEGEVMRAFLLLSKTSEPKMDLAETIPMGLTKVLHDLTKKNPGSLSGRVRRPRTAPLPRPALKVISRSR